MDSTTVEPSYSFGGGGVGKSGGRAGIGPGAL